MTLEIKHLQTSEAKIDLSHQKDYFAEWQMAELKVSKAEKEARHDKYKLCLAMAQYWIAVGYHCVDDRHKQRAEKRHYKWLELAEKFKEAK